MRRWWWRLGLPLVGATGLATAAGATPPLAAYGRLPSVDMIVVSPDGSKLAMVVGNAAGRQLQVRRVADRTVILTSDVGSAKVRGVRWAGENHLLVNRSTTTAIVGLTGPKREYTIVFDLDLTTRALTPLLDTRNDEGISRLKGAPDLRLNIVSGEPMPRIVHGRPVAFLPGVSFPGTAGVLTLYAVDLDTRQARPVAVGTADTQEFLVDAGGTLVARVDYHEATGHWTLYAGHGGHLARAIEDTQPLDAPWLAGLGRKPGTLLVGTRDDDHIGYREVDADGGAAVALPDLANGAPVADPASGLTIGAAYDDDLAAVYRFLDPADAAVWRKVVRGFGDAVVHLESWSDDRRTMVLRAEGKAVGAAYFVLDVATRRAAFLANEYAGIEVEDLGDKQAIHYAAADGTDIPAYLTLPPGITKATGLPLVVLPHGGPGARDDPGFDWWAQALASRGYAVLQPQFRGSTGFGEKFHAAGYGEWGRKMQTDLSDGVAYLAKAGTIDPKRVGIVGASHGGYAALAGVTLQHGIYACAVSLAGPADLKAMLAYEEAVSGGTKNETLRFWQRFMGAKSTSDPALDAISPAKFAATVEVPVLLIHGVDDTVVQFSQSKTMAAALKRAGKPVEFVTLAGEDHWLSRSETRTAMLTATAAFLAQHLPADPPAARPSAAP